MDGRMFEGLIAGVLFWGILIGAALVGILIGLAYLIGWVWSHLHWQ